MLPKLFSLFNNYCIVSFGKISNKYNVLTLILLGVLKVSIDIWEDNSVKNINLNTCKY